MRNWTSVLSRLIPVALSLLMVGCGKDRGRSGGSQGETASTALAQGDGKTIEFWHYFSEEQSKPLKELLAQFEQENPGVKVRAVFQGNPRDLKQKLDSSFAISPANNPVLATMYESWTDDFLKRGFIDPVQTHLDGPDGMTAEEQQDIVRAFREGNTWDGKLVTLPFNKSIYMLYVNSDKLAAAGFTTAPQTLATFADAVRKTTTREGGRVTTYGFGVQPRSEAFTTLFYAAGGRFLDESGKPTFNSPEALAALSLLRGLQYPEKHLYVNPDYMSNPFGNQLIAMYSYSSASFPYNKKLSAGKFRYDAAPVPSAEGAQGRYLMQGTNLGIFANRPEAERRNAWKLIKFLTTAKNSAFFATRSGYMPIRYSVLQQPEMQKYLAENPDYAVASSLVLSDKGLQEPKLAVWEGLRNDLDSMVDQVLSRGTDPQAALNEMQSKAEAKLN